MRAFPTRIEDAIFKKLEKQSKENRRSINSELNAILSDALTTRKK